MNGSEHAAWSPALSGPRLRVGAAALAVAVWGAALAHLGPGLRGLIGAAFCAVLVVLATYDLEQRRIPDRIVLPAIGAILVAQLLSFPEEALEWILAGVGAGLAFYLPTLFKAELVGIGDLKLAILLGVGLGGEVLLALLLGSVAAVPVALYLVITRGSSARNEVIPFGPFLAIGGVLALFLGQLPGG